MSNPAKSEGAARLFAAVRHAEPGVNCPTNGLPPNEASHGGDREMA